MDYLWPCHYFWLHYWFQHALLDFKCTRFRPLSLQVPKPLFPIAGVPLIEHHISQLCQLKDLNEIFLMGFYPAEQFAEFIEESRRRYNVKIGYIEESASLGTAGGLVLFKDELLKDDPKALFILNADVCGDLPVSEMVKDLDEKPEAKCLILTTEATRDQSINFGSVVIDQHGKVLHYVDKPTTFVSTHISCGIYLIRASMLQELEKAKNGSTQLWFETDIFPNLASTSAFYAFHTTRWWSQTKTAAAALYANRHYLRLYRESCPERLHHSGAEIVGDVYVDPTAEIDPSSKIGPNVSIGAKAKIGAGVRIRESIILPECVLEEHSIVLHSIIGWRSIVGKWARVEGTPIAPNPNIPFAKLDNKPLFNTDGRLNPSLTILGSDVHVPHEQVILNSVVLPYKDLSASYKNQIIL
uniref:Nucleotidyl transferase domain-containing protein n=1 Tax=Acrobeloides nanus TaxID=290746 RepID=A0A914DXM8_9BILA